MGSTRRSSLQLPQRTMVWPPWAGRRRCSSIAVSCATEFVGLWRFVEVCGQLWADREEDEEEGEVSQQQQQAKERRCPGSTCNGHGHRRRGATRMRPSSTIRAGRRKAPSVLRRSGPGNSRGRFYDWRPSTQQSTMHGLTKGGRGSWEDAAAGLLTGERGLP